MRTYKEIDADIKDAKYRLKTADADETKMLQLRLSILKTEMKTFKDASLPATTGRYVLTEEGEALKEMLSDPDRWLNHYVKTNNVTFRYSEYLMMHCIHYKDGSVVDVNDFYRQAHVYYINELRKNDSVKPIKMDREDMSTAIDRWVTSERSRVLTETLDSIKFDHTQDDSELVKWVNLIVNKPTKTDVNVIKHVLTLVKRKAFNMPVKYHMFPIFVGGQRIGKNWAIDILQAPFRGWIREFDITQVVDNTMTSAYGKNFIFNIPELSGADRADITKLKDRITSRVVDGRAPYNRYDTCTNNRVTFFGSANDDVSSFIRDPTGMGRFYQFDCRKRTEIEKADMDAIDPVKIWKCIDAYDDIKWYKEEEDNILKHQDGLTTPDPFVEWVETMGIKPKNDLHVQIISAPSRYASMKLYFEQNGYRACPVLATMGKKLSKLGIDTEQKVLNHIRYRFYVVDKHCQINEIDTSLQFNVNVA